MAGGNAIRGSRVGAGPMGEAERGDAAPRFVIEAKGDGDRTQAGGVGPQRRIVLHAGNVLLGRGEDEAGVAVGERGIDTIE